MNKYFIEEPDRVNFKCVGCGFHHSLDSRWSITWRDGKPTVTPSLLNTWEWSEKKEKKRCHLFIKNGQIQYLSDCTHEMAGKTIDMEVIK